MSDPAIRSSLRPINAVADGRRTRREWLMLGAVLLALAAFVGWSRFSAHQAIETQERARLEAQARAIDENLSRQVYGAWRALESVREDRHYLQSNEGGSGHASRRLVALSDAMPGVRTISLLDAQGRVLASNRTELIGGDFGEREYFRQVRDGADPLKLYLSLPFRSSLDVYSMNLSLMLPSADGGFGGIVTATLDPEYFQVVLHSVLYAPDMWAAIAHGDGRVLLYEPPRQSAVGMDLDRPGSMFRRHRDSGQSATVMSGRVLATGETMLIAQRDIRPADVPLDKGLVIAVTRDDEAMFAPWREQSAIYAALYLLLGVALSALLAVMQRSQRSAERQAAERAELQRAGAERLELALRGADLGLWDLDVRSGRAKVSERWNSMLGLRHDPDDADSASWRPRVHPDDWPAMHRAQQDHLAGRSERYEAVYRMRHEDGRWVWILDRGQVLQRDAQGAPLRMVGTHMDITERMLAQQALARSEESLAITLHSIGDAVIATDPRGLVVRLNAAAQRLTGWTEQDAAGQPLEQVFRIVNVHTREPALDPVQQVLARGEVVALADDTLLLSRDGGEYMISDSAAPIRGHDGKLTGVVLTFSDATARYRAEQALRENEQRLRAAQADLKATLEAVPDLLFEVDADGRFHDFHSPRHDLLYAEPQQFLGRRFDEVLPPDAAAVAKRALKQAEDRGRSTGLQYELPLPQGGRWFELSVSRKPMPLDLRPRFIVLARDITERKRAEFERQALEQQLREAQKMESIGTLAGGIAHDFNNILAAILGNVALARVDAAGEPTVLASLDQINRAALRARHLVQQILAFSRREQQGLSVQPLRPVVEESLGLLRATLPAGVQIDTVLPQATVMVRADATQLQQVLINLCTNAWHALPAQGGRIEVGFERVQLDEALRQRQPELAAGAYAHLWVSDNGSGMDAATRDRIFDPFFTTKPVGRGTGLGLSVVHGIVRAHEGSMAVDTAPGRGSTFHLYIPSPEADSDGDDARPARAADARGSGQRVLYIDDDEVMVVMVERLLERAGFNVTAEVSAVAAMERLRADPDAFDAVVTDFNMPEMSGVEVARFIGHLRPRLPIVISTGYLSEELREQAVAVGVRALLKKENTLEELAGLLRDLLAAR